MGNIKNRIAGKLEAVAGTVMKHAGKAVGNEELEARGVGHELAGAADQTVAKLSERVIAGGEVVHRTVNATIGAALGDNARLVEGKAKVATGKVRSALNQ